LKFQLDKARQYIQDQDRARQVELEDMRRQRDIDRLASESGAPRDKIEAAETYDDAVLVALKYARTAAQKALVAAQEQTPDPEREARNAVDVGGGRPPPPTDDWESRRLELLRAGDAHAYTMHIMGVTPGD